MVKICIYEGCKTQPTFNIEGETEALYCSKHKLEGMVDIKHKLVFVKDAKLYQLLIQKEKLRHCIVLSIN